MRETEEHDQNEYIRNAFILPKWDDICIVDMNELGESFRIIRRCIIDE